MQKGGNMKLYSLLLVSLFTFASGVFADEIRDGRVMCSLTSPSTFGFDLVKVRKSDRDYSGSYELNDIKFSGTYRSASATFSLEVTALNEEGEPIEQLLQIDSKLRVTENLHVKFKRDESNIELYCYFFPNQ